MSNAQVHRFYATVAAYVGDGSTVYMKPSEARALARALNACARDVRNHPNFVESQFTSATIQLTGSRSAAVGR